MSLVFGTTIGDTGWFAGGGGGFGDARSGAATRGLGGQGGGGQGASGALSDTSNEAGQANTGGGAGAGGPAGDGKAGGSGIIVIKYPVEWTPAAFSNIKAWWKGGDGLTMNPDDTTRVEKWVDSINGYEVTQSVVSNPNLTDLERSPTIDSSYTDLNNQPIVRFGMTTNGSFTNAPQYMYTTGSFPSVAGNSYTQIIICDYISRNGANAFSSPIIGHVNTSSAKRIWFDRILADGDMRSLGGLGAAALQVVDTNTNIALGSEKVIWQQYQAASADTYTGNNTTTGSLRYNGSVTNDTWATTTLFTINGFVAGTSNVGALQFTRANDMAVAEVILIYGEPSASEWAEFKSYVSTTYGITIS